MHAGCWWPLATGSLTFRRRLASRGKPARSPRIGEVVGILGLRDYAGRRGSAGAMRLGFGSESDRCRPLSTSSPSGRREPNCELGSISGE